MPTRRKKIVANKLKAQFAKKKAQQQEAAKIGPRTPEGWTPPPIPEDKPIEKKVRRATRKDMESAIAWFYAEIKGELGSDNRAKSRIRRIPDKAFNASRDAFIGGLFFYIYDAKWKDELPYWDQFPLVIPIKPYNDGFLGLNLHYLPPLGRAKLLDILQKYKRRAATPKAYMRVSYEILKASVNDKLFAPCVHRYLTTHIKSDIVKVADEFWYRAAMLPVQKFVGASDRDVWSGRAGKQTRKRKK